MKLEGEGDWLETEQKGGVKKMDWLITDEMVRARLQRLRTDKSPGPDGIHPKFLCETADQMAYPLAEMFRRSLSSGTVPEDWRLAEVSPIFKKGSRKMA